MATWRSAVNLPPSTFRLHPVSSDIHQRIQELHRELGRLYKGGRRQETIELGRQLLRLIHEHNRLAWDSMARQGQPLTTPARDEALRRPMDALDRRGWLEGDVAGKRVLCLAGGGGKLAVLFAAAGAVVTVVDLSPEMLAHDREMASRLALEIQTVEASMDDLSMLHDASFDLVEQPVSTCYVPSLAPVHREVARVLVPGGLYISQHKQPASLQADTIPSGRGYELIEPYYRSGPLPPAGGGHREPGTLEFLHRWEDLLGGLCRSGFVIEDVVEPSHADDDAEQGTFAHRCRYAAPYIRIKARRVERRWRS